MTKLLIRSEILDAAIYRIFDATQNQSPGFVFQRQQPTPASADYFLGGGLMGHVILTPLSDTSTEFSVPDYGKTELETMTAEDRAKSIRLYEGAIQHLIQALKEKGLWKESQEDTANAASSEKTTTGPIYLPVKELDKPLLWGKQKTIHEYPNGASLQGFPDGQTIISNRVNPEDFLGASDPSTNRLDGFPRGKSTAFRERISRRKDEALRLHAEGKTQQEIADALGVSLDTVKRIFGTKK